MRNTVKKRLHDTLTACYAIREYTSDIEFDDYQRRRMVRSAVERELEIIGEALNVARGEDDSLHASIPQLYEVIGLRNRVIHGYDSVDNKIIWEVASTHVPILIEQLSEILEN